MPTRLTTGERVALACFALAGAAIVPGGLNRFVFPKLALACLGVLFAVLAPARGRLSLPARLGLAAAALLLTLAALRASAPGLQLIGAAPRYEGLLALSIYAGALAAGARLLGPERPGEALDELANWLSYAALLIGALAIAQRAGLDLLAGTGRPGSLLGNASEQGAWALLALGPVLAAAIERRRGFYLAGSTACLVALLCAGSRGALLGALVVLLVTGLLARPRRPTLPCLFAALVLSGFLLPGLRTSLTSPDRTATATVEGRRLLWSESVRLARAHPLLGVGPNGFADALPAWHTARFEARVGPQNPPDSPHNWLLQAAAAGGFALAALALAFAVSTLARGAGLARADPALAGLLAALGGYAIALLFHFTAPGTTPLAALFAGALLAERAPARAAPRAARALVAAALALGCLVLCAAALAERPLHTALEQAASGRLQRADAEFSRAQRLRPWDRSLPGQAAHAFAALSDAGLAGAAHFGQRWSATDLASDARSVRALTDAAALARGAGDTPRARMFLRKALALDPRNTELRARLARLG